ncbi:MAG: imidazolonepropionase [Chitinophagales bacterium]|nr:imidazolonepropionase [Bacteroidota bacterium]MCB9042821.1 imidazolonepropionase [Chitinophagales bacterium]
MHLLLKNIRQLWLTETENRLLYKGKEMSEVPFIENAFLYIKDGHFADFGTMDTLTNFPEDTEVIDASGQLVLPAWCDSHTHIVFAASREEEFLYRLQGMTYEEIAEKGGGILNSARKLQTTSENDLFASAWQRLQNVMAMGTGAIEIKSGYGLSVAAELKMLRVIQRLKEKAPIPIKATFLGAHAVPMEYKTRRNEYINLIINEMLPQIASESLADYCDVFCDKGFFTPDETETILEAAWKYGLKPKIHANELAVSGGVQTGVKMNAVSVDHLECITQTEIDCLLASETMPTVLPGTSFFLNIAYSPARKMIENGLPVCIATDYNPGSTPSGNMAFTVALACTQQKLLPQEALAAATLNGAAAMEIAENYGSISIGKVANFILTKKIPSLAYMPYAYGENHIDKVFFSGKLFTKEK